MNFLKLSPTFIKSSVLFLSIGFFNVAIAQQVVPAIKAQVATVAQPVVTTTTNTVKEVKAAPATVKAVVQPVAQPVVTTTTNTVKEVKATPAIVKTVVQPVAQPVVTTTNTVKEVKATPAIVKTVVQPVAQPVVTTTTNTIKAAPAAVKTVVQPVKAEAKPATNVKIASPTASPSVKKATITPKTVARPQPVPAIVAQPDEDEAMEEPIIISKREEKVIVAKSNLLERFNVSFPTTIQIQASKFFYDKIEDEELNNLDEWWGRASFGVHTQKGNFEGLFSIDAYPANFGNNYISSVSPTTIDTIPGRTEIRNLLLSNGNIVSDTNVIKDQMIVNEGKTTYQKSAATEVTEAWASYDAGIVKTRVGRFTIDDKNGSFFGNYLDKQTASYLSSTGSTIDSRISSSFLLEAPTIDALELGFDFGDLLYARLQLESTDPNLNRGNLRLYFEFENLTSLNNLTFGLGYKSNLFDLIKYNDSTEMVTNVDLTVKGKIKPNFNIFGEIAIVDVSLEDEDGNQVDPLIPITIGAELPFTLAFDKTIVEFEFESTRDKKFLGSLLLEKKITDYFNFQAGMYSYGQTRDLGMSLRMTAEIN